MTNILEKNLRQVFGERNATRRSKAIDVLYAKNCTFLDRLLTEDISAAWVVWGI